MATFEEDFYAYVSGGVAPTLLYPDHIPEDKGWPVLCVNQVAATHGNNLAGASGQCEKRLQFCSASTDKLQAVNLSESLRLLLHGYRGTMGSTLVLSIIPAPESEHDAYQQPENAGDQGVYQRYIEYTVKYKEAIPTFGG